MPSKFKNGRHKSFTFAKPMLPIKQNISHNRERRFTNFRYSKQRDDLFKGSKDQSLQMHGVIKNGKPKIGTMFIP